MTGRAPGRNAPRRRPFAALVALTTLAAVPFAAGAWRWAFVCDDAFITFRYAAHLAAGLGPVWNAGERVEGYTDFLWMLLMAGTVRLGLDPVVVSRLVGVACGLGVLAVVARQGLAAYRERPWIAALAPLLLASSRSFAAWSTGGLETTAFTLLVVVAAWRTEVEDAGGGPRPASALLWAAATLTRPEGALFGAVAALWWAGRTVFRRRRAGPLVAWCVVGALPVLTHLGWRLAYYGDWLPNTFRAKVPGLWWDQGLRYLGLFADDYLALLFLPLALAALAFARRPAVALRAMQTAAYLVYVAAIGGDRFEFRFLVPVLPLYWLLHADGLDAVLARVRGPARRRVASGLAGAVSAALLVSVGASHLRGADAGTRHGVADLGVVSRYAASRIGEGRFLRGLIDRGLLPRDVVICVGGAGALPYYTDWTTIDRRGLNDRRIATTALAARGRVAHEHDVDYAYLVERGVIVFDAANRIVHDELVSGPQPQWFELDGVPMPVRAVRAGDRYLVFASPAPWDAYRDAFGRLEILY